MVRMAEYHNSIAERNQGHQGNDQASQGRKQKSSTSQEYD